MYQCNLTVCLAIILPCSQLYLYLFDCQLYEMKPFFSYTKCWKSTKFDKSPEQLLNDSLSWLYESVEACVSVSLYFKMIVMQLFFFFIKDKVRFPLKNTTLKNTPIDYGNCNNLYLIKIHIE